MQCKQMWTFLEVFTCRSKFYAFNAATIFILSLSFAEYIVLCHSSLFIMSAKDEKSDVFSSFKKAKGEFLAGSHAFCSNKRLLNSKRLFLPFLLMQMCAR